MGGWRNLVFVQVGRLAKIEIPQILFELSSKIFFN